VAVGQTGLSGSLQITYQNTFPNATHPNNVTAVHLTMSCGAQVGAEDCPTAPDQRDPGVFTIDAAATGQAGTACAGIGFTVSLLDAASGKVQFTPGFTVTNTPPHNTCIIDFTFSVNMAATKDADPSLS